VATANHDRPRTPSNAPRLAEIQRIGVDADLRFVDVRHPELADGATISSDVAHKGIVEGRITIAEADGAIAGWVYVGRLEEALCIGQISVERAFGRRGGGSTLLRTVVTRARSEEEPSIVLNTQSDVPWNQPCSSSRLRPHPKGGVDIGG
jgi:hypothetical protein